MDYLFDDFMEESQVSQPKHVPVKRNLSNQMSYEEQNLLDMKAKERREKLAKELKISQSIAQQEDELKQEEDRMANSCSDLKD